MLSKGSWVLAGAVGVAAVVAALRPQRPPPGPAADETREAPEAEQAFTAGDDPQGDQLPPDHPPIGGMNPGQEQAEPGPAEPQAIVWKAPAKWTVMPNPNAMRLATYHIPAAKAAPDQAELSVVQAGGTTEANLQRWVEQFADAEPGKRAQKMVHGLKVSTLEVTGTLQGAAMGTSEPAQERHGWSLMGAVVETDQGTYFFKMTGPTPSVRAARGDFDALLNTIAPTAGSSSL